MGIPQNGWFRMDNRVEMYDLGAPPLMDPPFMGSNTVVYHHCPYWLMPFGGIPNFTYFQTKPFLGLTMINTTLG